MFVPQSVNIAREPGSDGVDIFGRVLGVSFLSSRGTLPGSNLPFLGGPAGISAEKTRRGGFASGGGKKCVREQTSIVNCSTPQAPCSSGSVAQGEPARRLG